MRPPRERAGTTTPRCTDSNTLPALDVIATLTIAGLGLLAANTSEYDCEDCSGGLNVTTLLVGLGLATPFAISAGIGFHRVDECREATPPADGPARQVPVRDPAAWDAARAAGRLGREGEWCRTATVTELGGVCDDGLTCVDGSCRRVCRETSPGSSNYTCGVGYRCTEDFKGCEPRQAP